MHLKRRKLALTINEDVMGKIQSFLCGWGQFPVLNFYDAPKMGTQQDMMSRSWVLQQLGDYPLVVIGESQMARVSKVPCPSTR